MGNLLTVVLSGLTLVALAMAHASSFDDSSKLERTCFQTSQPYGDAIDLRADVAIVYGIGKDMPARVDSWRNRGYRVHLMTGVAWGEYQDYLYGRFDGVNHEDEAQTDRNGQKIGHGGDVYYMSPGPSYGKYLSVGVKRALDAGVEAIHLEEPEFWSAAGYSEAFKREWASMYGEPWQAPDSSVDARWRASKLKYFLYRRALQQVFDFVQDYNAAHHTAVRCYVPTHSLINYATWGIVSPESSLARLRGCDGYIAQVWTGTARTPNVYRGEKKERTFETAFLEYGAMMNLVRSTGRKVWFLADPVEDNPNHDWRDYKENWEATLTASLLQPDVSSYEIMPWPERIYHGEYPSAADHSKRVPIPPEYATELANVTHALKDVQMPPDGNVRPLGIGVLISDSLMFERGDPSGSDEDLGHFFGLALPFVKAGIPVEPVQVENVTLPHYLDQYRVLYMTYRGQKPQTRDVHAPIVSWVRKGGHLIFVDDDGDPYNHVREWWNGNGKTNDIPRELLFRDLSVSDSEGVTKVGKGSVQFIRRDPTSIAQDPDGPELILSPAREAFNGGLKTNDGLYLRRGLYSVYGPGKQATTDLAVDLFDPQLRLEGWDSSSCRFTLDVSAAIAMRRTYLVGPNMDHERITPSAWNGVIEGPAGTPAVALLHIPNEPTKISVDDQALTDYTYDALHQLLWIRFPMTGHAQNVSILH